MGASAMTREFDLIARIASRVRPRRDVALGIGDDAAVLDIPPGHDLVVTMDTLNTGIHFPPETDPASIGWKALAVNLSDLAAMAATPAWCTLSLALPDADAAWLDAFLDGFLALAGQHDCTLVGGDTTRGPLSISVAAHGLVPHGGALRRSGAQPGDDVWVTGTLGDAAEALATWRATASLDGIEPRQRERLERPTPRVDTGARLRGLATAAIDLSDGLAADLGHLLAASRAGALIDPQMIPGDADLVHRLAGGDDYELCFTAPAQHRATLKPLATRIGHIDATPGLRLNDGTPIPRGWTHFA